MSADRLSETTVHKQIAYFVGTSGGYYVSVVTKRKALIKSTET
jgi:hypothetical protein